uniref:Si:dkey-49c17.4 n=1 Tax=Sparus aurata TaxID=8175 RepID=A0A671XC50_SPAAU
MMLAGFLFLLLLTDGESSNDSCSYLDIFTHLYPKGKGQNTMVRPVKNHTTTTEALLAVLIYAILDLNEKDQKFVSYVWIDMHWKDEYISWNEEDFCGIDKILIPTKQLWMPDLTIEEMTEKDKASASPYLTVFNDSEVWLRNDMLVISTCKMNVYKFPFDIQSCNLSFKSAMYSDEEMQFFQIGNSSRSTNWTLTMIRSQSEWLLINMDITNTIVDNFGLNQSMLVYTIHMKRRYVLYIVNFMLPILFFLGLDLASFLISDSGGEKLGFKVTVLLAVTVMQLILNEILPSSSDRIPLIGKEAQSHCTAYEQEQHMLNQCVVICPH